MYTAYTHFEDAALARLGNRPIQVAYIRYVDMKKSYGFTYPDFHSWLSWRTGIPHRNLWPTTDKLT
jgi:hypothetical protein